MHALSRVGSVTNDLKCLVWAVELAKGVHPAFTHSLRFGGRKRMYWKLSTDLSRPLVASMGQHDPLDGLVTYSEIRARARKLGIRSDLDEEIADMTGMVQGRHPLTDDALGVGGLLSDAWRIAQLTADGGFDHSDLPEVVLDSALFGAQAIAESDLLGLPAEHMLAFRELGLSIGLKGIERTKACIVKSPGKFSKEVAHSAGAFITFFPLAETIDDFWTNDRA